MAGVHQSLGEETQIPISVYVAAMVMALLALEASAQAPTSCTNTFASISPCIGFITGGSGNSAGSPTSDCCSALAGAAANTAVCLCQLLGTNSPLGFPINQTRVLVLPGACNMNIPPLDKCTDAGTPLAPSTGSSPPTSGANPAKPSVPPAESPTDASKDEKPSPTENSNSTGNGNTDLINRSGSRSVVAASSIDLVAGLSLLTIFLTCKISLAL